MIREPLPNFRRLYCSRCGVSTYGRQWHNMDTGHGICPGCWLWLLAHGEDTPEAMSRTYGTPRVYHSLSCGYGSCKDVGTSWDAREHMAFCAEHVIVVAVTIAAHCKIPVSAECMAMIESAVRP